MPDFWRDSGFHLLRRQKNGHLEVSDAYLQAYYRRPEIRPVEESCAVERSLHEALLADPRRAVPESRLAGLADPDARDNYRILLAYRDQLLAAGTLEACYLKLFSDAGPITIPPLFIAQMTHAMLRSILEPCSEPLRARAAELLFRPQKITIQDGTIMAADAETVEMYAAGGGFGDLGRLVAEAQTPLRSVELDVIDEHNAELYWTRDSRYDTVLNLSFAGAGLDALSRVLEAWVRHFLDIEVAIQPVQQISDERWRWHVGLDAEGTRLLNDLYHGVEVEEDRLARLLSLFRIEFRDASVVPEDFAGRPVYLAMCMSADNLLRLKPQNLLVNLPLVERA